MKFSASFYAFCALAASVGTAATKLSGRSSGMLAPRSAFSTGAAYFMTNKNSGNTIVAADIGVDGTLSLSQWYSTGGFGQHGMDALPGGPDPLFSQGSVQVHPSGLLGVVNSGSNTVSLFQIDPVSPSTLTQIGQPVATGGEFPISVAFNQAGNMACVLNGGFVNGVMCYTVDNTTGLTPIPGSFRPLNINVNTPPAGPFGSASQVIFTPDQENVVAITKGSPFSGVVGFMASWSLNGTTLSPTYTRVELPPHAGVPFSISAIPGQNALIGTDAAVGTFIYDLSQGVSQAFSAPATSTLAVPGQKAICWQAYSNSTGNFYVTDILTNQITEINVASDLSSSVVAQYNTFPHAAALDLEVATVDGNDYLYTLLPNLTSVHVMSLEGSGEASVIQVLDIASTLQAAKVPFDGGNLQGMATWSH